MPVTLADLRQQWDLAEAGIRAHVSKFEAGVQGGDEWKSRRMRTVGGSELATLLGENPYSSAAQLLGRKLGFNNSDPGEACWWGTMFEAVSERLVELECGTKTYGTGIHMHVPELIEGHANSPDGFCVVVLAEDEAPPGGGPPRMSLARGLEDPRVVAAPERAVVLPALLELKAPYRRIPDGRPPKHYRAQVQSGIALSQPAVALGLFCEVSYRLCTLEQMDAPPPRAAEYCTHYHAKDVTRREPPQWTGPLAWGVTAVYAPYTVAPDAAPDAAPETLTDEQRMQNAMAMFAQPTAGARASGGTNVRAAAVSFFSRALAKHLGFVPRKDDLGEQVADLGELGDANPRDFNELLGYIDKRVATVAHSPIAGPVGETDGAGLARFMRDAAAAPPAGMYLFGLLPWKVFQADYHLLGKEEGFLDRIRPPVADFMATVNELSAAPDPQQAYQRHCSQKGDTAALARRRERARDELDSGALGSLFASVAAFARATAAPAE